MCHFGYFYFRFISKFSVYKEFLFLVGVFFFCSIHTCLIKSILVRVYLVYQFLHFQFLPLPTILLVLSMN